MDEEDSRQHASALVSQLMLKIHVSPILEVFARVSGFKRLCSCTLLFCPM